MKWCTWGLALVPALVGLLAVECGARSSPPRQASLLGRLLPQPSPLPPEQLCNWPLQNLWRRCFCLALQGVRGDHVEFEYLDGTPGTRAQPFWGFNDSNPLEDCPKDAGRYYGRGSYAASLCCGTSTGVAKGATIQSGGLEGVMQLSWWGKDVV